jgi:pyridoxal phosphate enzyme (YggS family)
MIRERVSAIRERMARAAEGAGRSPSEVTLVAVGKTQPAESLRAAYEAGIRDFGENRVQEAEGKSSSLRDLEGIRWHLVGHLQGNKARAAAGLFHVVHSLDSVDLGTRLARVALESGRVVDALVEVELGGEDSKHGLKARDVLETLRALQGAKGLRLSGLMCIPPPADDPERMRPFFRSLRALRDQARGEGLLQSAELSMGMSHDFEVAIEEGATLVRVGTAIFGERRPRPDPGA